MRAAFDHGPLPFGLLPVEPSADCLKERGDGEAASEGEEEWGTGARRAANG
jgi:hypothetical protein